MPEDTSEVFARRVRQTREARAWTRLQLVDRLAEIGLRIDRMAITRIEAGRRGRRVEIGEAVTLAVALDVPLSYLLSPLDSDEPLQIGSHVVTGGQLDAWLAGDAPLPIPGVDADHYLWGAGPQGRNLLASVLRKFVKLAETATADELPAVAEGAAAAITGLVEGLRLLAEQEK